MQPFKNYITGFSKLLATVNSSTITSNNYASSYLQTLLQHKHHYLHIYAMVLEKAFAATNSNQVCLLDFGTGNGLLAIFAKYCGVKEVHASDVSASFLIAAQQLSKQLNIELDGWIIGDENTLLKHFANKQLDVVVGTDVIEHVYNLDHLFFTLQTINPSIVTVFTTASVAENPFKSRSLKKLQIKDELTDSNAFQSAEDHDFAGVSFLEIRKKIITNYTNRLSEKELHLLAINTRGLIKNDIEHAVTGYLNNKTIPKPPIHATNTCDPITGSWTERLLPVKEYQQIYRHHNLILLLHCGFYNSFEKGIKAKLGFCVNLLITMLGNFSLPITPFIVLEGRPTKKLTK